MAILPFKGQVDASWNPDYPRSNIPKKYSAAPTETLELKWAHGFRSFDTRDNLKYTKNGDVLFTTAGVGVVQTISQQNNHTQRFFNQHAEDVVAMALHPDGDTVATG